MAGNILTPSAVWKDFRIDEQLTFETVEEEKRGDLALTRIYLNGRTVKDGTVKIYGVLVRNVNVLSSPAILCVQDFRNGADEEFAVKLAEKGYAAFTIDVAGEYKDRKYHTVYPPSLSFANFDKEKYRDTVINEEINNTFWYEWGCAVKYALRFLKGQRFVSSVGAFGISGAATPLWYAVATEKDVACAVFVGNAGWRGYNGIYKFTDAAEPQFDDDKFRYLAAVDPQAYASHVSCPVYIIAPTNSAKFDADRAYDTITRIDGKYYSAVDYSVGARNCAVNECFKSALVFMNRFLYGGAAKFPDAPVVKTELADGNIKIEVTPDRAGLKKVMLYAAEGTLKPQYRSWLKVGEPVAEENGKLIYNYRPYAGSEMTSFFVRAAYADGFIAASPVVYRKFAEKGTGDYKKFRILYSSRIADCESEFYPAAENLTPPYGVDCEEGRGVKVKKGPMDMYGVSCPDGILTFKINAEKYRPDDGMFLMLDAYGKREGYLTVKLIADYFGKRTEYCAAVKMVGGDVWQNVKIEQNKFKTPEGMILKSYEKIEAIEFDFDGECVINNVLWV